MLSNSYVPALENLPKIGYKARAHLMNAMVPGLGEASKMVGTPLSEAPLALPFQNHFDGHELRLFTNTVLFSRVQVNQTPKSTFSTSQQS